VQLIPEFFTSPGDFMTNNLDLVLGIKADKSPVGDVILPAWANGTFFMSLT